MQDITTNTALASIRRQDLHRHTAPLRRIRRRPARQEA
jgi:hypothetical protein